MPKGYMRSCRERGQGSRGYTQGIPRCAPGTLLNQCRLHKTKKHTRSVFITRHTLCKHPIHPTPPRLSPGPRLGPPRHGYGHCFLTQLSLSLSPPPRQVPPSSFSNDSCVTLCISTGYTQPAAPTPYVQQRQPLMSRCPSERQGPASPSPLLPSSSPPPPP